MSEPLQAQADKSARIAEFENFKPKFPLLSRVRDRISGFTGTVAYVMFTYYGPPIYGIQPRIRESNPQFRSPVPFSEAELVLVADGTDSRERFIADGCQVKGPPAPIQPVLIQLGSSVPQAQRLQRVAELQAEVLAKSEETGDDADASLVPSSETPAAASAPAASGTLSRKRDRSTKGG